MVDSPETAIAPAINTPEPTPVPTFKVGDTIPLRTGMILDTNRHMVPDGTPVRFLFTTGGDTTVAQTIESVTVMGVARASYRIERAGLLEITATSDPAFNSDKLQLDITGGESAAITAIVPTAVPTETPTPTATLTPTVTPTITPLPTPEPKPEFGDWVLALGVVIGSSAIGLWLGASLIHIRWGVRWALCILLGGLLAYNYVVLKFPGSEMAIAQSVTSGIIWSTLFGVVLGAAVGGIWWWVTERQKGNTSGLK